MITMFWINMFLVGYWVIRFLTLNTNPLNRLEMYVTCMQSALLFGVYAQGR